MSTNNPYQEPPKETGNLVNDLSEEYNRQVNSMFFHPIKWGANTPFATIVYMLAIQFATAVIFIEPKYFAHWSAWVLPKIIGGEGWAMVVRWGYFMGKVTLCWSLFLTGCVILGKVFGVGKIPTAPPEQPEEGVQQPQVIKPMEHEIPAYQADFSEPPITVKEAEDEEMTGAKFCPKCGKLLDTSMKFCFVCGSRLAEDDE